MKLKNVFVCLFVFFIDIFSELRDFSKLTLFSLKNSHLLHIQLNLKN